MRALTPRRYKLRYFITEYFIKTKSAHIPRVYKLHL